jgi:hypothetical protein
MSVATAATANNWTKSCVELEKQAVTQDSIDLCAPRSVARQASCPKPKLVGELIPPPAFTAIRSNFVNRCEWVRRNLCPAYSVKEVYRPHTGDNERLVETNPHRKSGALVCPGHSFEFYVMRNPLASPERVPLGRTVAELRLSPEITKIESMAAICIDRTDTQPTKDWAALPADARAIGQWPPANDRHLSGKPMRGFVAAPQTPAVFFRCEPDKPLPPCADKTCTTATRDDHQTRQLVLTGLLGAGAAFAVARVWPSSSSPPMPGSASSGAVAAGRRTRVRVDTGRPRGDG